VQEPYRDELTGDVESVVAEQAQHRNECDLDRHHQQ
jgi:hypothetical protein